MFYVYLLHSERDNVFYRVKGFASHGLVGLSTQAGAAVAAASPIASYQLKNGKLAGAVTL